MSPPRRGLALGDLEIPGENVTGKNRGTVEEVPARGLRTTEVDPVGRIRPVFSEDRVIQFRGPIFAPESESGSRALETPLWRLAPPRMRRPAFSWNPLVPSGLISSHRGHPLPGISLLARVDIDAGSRMKEIVQVGHQRDRRDRQQGVID